MEKLKPYQLKNELLPFWEDYFTKIKVTNPVFLVKVAYAANQTEGEPSIRFFESELDTLEESYIELVDFNNNNYHKTVKILYKLKHDANWGFLKEKYIPVQSKASVITYIVKLSDLEICVEHNNKNNVPEIEPVLTPLVLAGLTKGLNLENLQDDKLSTVSVRELYCILHNVPLTKREWLNDLITEGNVRRKSNQDSTSNNSCCG